MKKHSESDSIKEWSNKIGRVFRSKPRVGHSKGIVWLNRIDIEREFEKNLLSFGINVCLDGPTGTGKTSLALTTLNRLKLKFTHIQITQNMDWKGFCRRIIEPKHNRESSIIAEILASLEGPLPKGSIKFTLGTKGKPSDQYELWDKVISNCDEADICRAISTKDAVLMIDDFEKANEEIVIRVADMCKLITQTYPSEMGKLLVVGTGDIYRRLYSADRALEERLEQFSLGTLPSPTWSWKYLQLGFEALGLYHPAKSKYSTKEENIKCMNEVYKACNGLFKGLTRLGREICNAHNPETRGISAKSIISEAQKIPSQNYKRFRRKFPVIFRCCEGNLVVRSVLHYLYDRGIGQIYNWTDVTFDLRSKYPSGQIDNAIAELVQCGLLVQTGRENETIFVTEPVMAHTLGVIVSYPDDFDLPQEYVRIFGQYKLPFLTKGNLPNKSIAADS